MKNLNAKKSRRFWLMLGIAVLLCGLAVSALMPARQTYTVGPETSVAVGPLDADGYVDYVAALNERLRGKITPERNANVLIWQAIGPRPSGANTPPDYFKWLGRPAPPEQGVYLVDWITFLNSRHPDLGPVSSGDKQAVKAWLDRVRKWPWKTDDEPDIAAWLVRNATPLEKLVEASKLTDYYNPLIPKDRPNGQGIVFNHFLSNVEKYREAAVLLGSRAMLRLGSGRTNDAWTDLITCHRLGRLFQQGSTLIELLVGISVESIAQQGEAIFLSQANLTRQQVDACMADLRGLPAPAKAADKIDLAERFLMLDVMQILARNLADGLKALDMKDNGADNRIMYFGVFARSNDWNVAMKTANTHYDRLIATLRIEDLTTRMEKKAALDAEKNLWSEEMVKHIRAAALLGAGKRGELIGNIVGSQMSGIAFHIKAAEERLAQENEHLILAFALKARHLDTGDYPAKLEDLAPKYLAKIPIDRFAAGPLKYERPDNGYRFYSVGPNRVDEKGAGQDDFPSGDDLTITMPAIGPAPLPEAPVPPEE